MIGFIGPTKAAKSLLDSDSSLKRYVRGRQQEIEQTISDYEALASADLPEERLGPGCNIRPSVHETISGRCEGSF